MIGKITWLAAALFYFTSVLLAGDPAKGTEGRAEEPTQKNPAQASGTKATSSNAQASQSHAGPTNASNDNQNTPICPMKKTSDWETPGIFEFYTCSTEELQRMLQGPSLTTLKTMDDARNTGFKRMDNQPAAIQSSEHALGPAESNHALTPFCSEYQ